MIESNVYLYYRTYPGWSGKNLFENNKIDLIKVTWKSLEIDKEHINATAFIDNPTEEFKSFLSERIKNHHYTFEGSDCYDSKNKLPLFGGGGTYFILRDVMSKNNHKDDDIILILEDDYLFVPEGFLRWIDACRHFEGFVSPLDHPNRYTRKDDLYAKKTPIYMVNGHHWRKSESTTNTFGGKYKYFKKTYFISKLPRLYFYSFWPGRLFGKELTSMDRIFFRRVHYIFGIDLFTPVPGLAAHLAKNELDSVIDWEKRYLQIKADLQ